MQTENRLFEDFSKVATSALGTLTGVGREIQENTRARAREFLGGVDSIDRDEFEAVKANAAAARDAVEVLKAEIAALQAAVAALQAAVAALQAGAAAASPS